MVRVLAQVAMVMNLDKCIGCHTCSVTCKQTWTNREGTEYVWFNNVETKPGIGYPKGYEDQERWKGGWVLDRKGRLQLKSGGRVKRLGQIFANPHLPTIDDYYEPATYDYDALLSSPARTDDTPVARPISRLTGDDMAITWGANWEDQLGGTAEHGPQDPNLATLTPEARQKVKFEFEKTFLFHLPRICEHCLNPACVSACPSGAMYKREEDGIVLVDQDTCRGWRMCVTACPYKKVYTNTSTGKAEKCTFCFPRIEAGMNDEWIEAAQLSPIWKLAMKFRVALPLHPEYRTMPMVWYIPPLSPVLDAVKDRGGDETDADDVFHAIADLRIPVEYLASIFTAGDSDVVGGVLMKLAAMRSYMRELTLDGTVRQDLLDATGMNAEDLEELYRLLAIAKYEDRYIIPAAAKRDAAELEDTANSAACSLEKDGAPGMGGETVGAGQVLFGATLQVRKA